MFSIEITDQKTHLEYDKPTDELGEFSGWEMGLFNYFFENNNWVKIKVGYQEIQIPMYTDLAYLFQDFPPAIYYLSHDREAELSFAEFNSRIRFSPSDSQIKCVLTTENDNETIVLDKQIVLEV